MRVSIVAATRERQEVVEVELAQGATVADALERVRSHPAFAGIEWEAVRVGVWSRECARDQRLREGDRVEIYRPLVADPKTQRRSRARLRSSTRSRNAP